MHSSPHSFVGGYIKPDVKEQLLRLARRNDRSQSAEIRRALNDHIARGLVETDRVPVGDMREAIAR
jgi:predicted transcriptional regulator